MQPKMLSAAYVSLRLLTYVECEDKRRGPRSGCSKRSSLIWVYTVCQWGFETSQRNRKQTTFIVIGAFRVNSSHTKHDVCITEPVNMCLYFFMCFYACNSQSESLPKLYTNLICMLYTHICDIQCLFFTTAFTC